MQNNILFVLQRPLLFEIAGVNFLQRVCDILIIHFNNGMWDINYYHHLLKAMRPEAHQAYKGSNNEEYNYA